MKIHRDAAVGADQERYASFAKLVELVRERRPPRRRELVVRQPVGMLERLAHVVDDVLRQAFFPRRIVERFRVVAEVFVVQQSLSRRRPPQRAERHLRRPLANHRDDVGWILRRARKAGMLEAVDAGG